MQQPQLEDPRGVRREAIHSVDVGKGALLGTALVLGQPDNNNHIMEYYYYGGCFVDP